jgi:hypothetical protein
MKIRAAGALFVIAAAMALTAAPANAATITVAATNDPGLVNDGTCSLREAMAEANSDNAAFSGDCTFTGTLGSDTITLTADTYTIGLGPLNVADTDALTLTRASGLTMIDANGSSGVINHSAGSLTLTRVGVREGVSSFDGAGISNAGGNLTITDSRIASNRSDGTNIAGAGIQMTAGTLDVTRTAFDQNQALASSGDASGGAIQFEFGGGGSITDSEFLENEASTTGGGGNSSGGAISASANAAGSAIAISGSSFIDNQASNTLGTGFTSIGGAIRWVDAGNAAGLVVNNSTFSGNGVSGSTGGGSNRGGAVSMQGGANKFAQVTFGGNSTTAGGSEGDAIDYQSSSPSTLQIRGSIFDDSGSDECVFNLGNPPTSFGYNVDQGTTCGLAIAGQDKQNQDAATLAPALNGGPTRTRALAGGTPAVDANGGCTSTANTVVTADQRGFPRGSTSPEDGTACDSGAYERLTCKGQNVTIFGTEGANNPIAGTPGNDVIAGLGGADQINGGDGADRICGGDGDDTILPGPGDDQVDGGPGANELSFVDSDGVHVDLAAGTANGTSAGSDTGITNIRDVFGSLQNDTIAGDGQANEFDGHFGSDSLEGRGGSDTLNGTEGIFATPGDRAVYDEAPSAVTVDLGASQVTGGDGTDTLIAIEDATGSAFDDVFRGNGDPNFFDGLAGADEIDYGFVGTSVNVNLVTGMSTGGANDFLTSIEDVTTSSDGEDTVVGNDVANVIQTRDLNDTVTGGGGSDTIITGQGDDSVFARDSTPDTIDCGDNGDTAELDALAVDSAVTNCETLSRPVIPDLTPPPTGTTQPPAIKCKKGQKRKKVKGKFKCVKKPKKRKK